MREVYSSENDVDVTIVKGILEEEGIETITRAAGAGNCFSHLGIRTGISQMVYVKDSEYDKARVIVNKYKLSQKIKSYSIESRIFAIVALIVFVLIILFEVYSTLSN